MFRKSIIGIATATVLGGCSSYYGGGDYEWIGCHVVIVNPSKEGAHAFSIGDVEVGHKIYFKEIGKDGKVGKITTARPCTDSD